MWSGSNATFRLLSGISTMSRSILLPLNSRGSDFDEVRQSATATDPLSHFFAENAESVDAG